MCKFIIKWYIDSYLRLVELDDTSVDESNALSNFSAYWSIDFFKNRLSIVHVMLSTSLKWAF